MSEVEVITSSHEFNALTNMTSTIDEARIKSNSNMIEISNMKDGNVSGSLQNQIGSLNTNLGAKASQADLNTTNVNLDLKADKSEVTNVMTPKGNSLYASLPTTGNTVGWYYYCSDGDGTHGAGNYAWSGTSWYFGGTGDEGYNIVSNNLNVLNKTIYQWTDGYYRESTNVVAHAQFSYATINVVGIKKIKIKTWLCDNPSIVFYNGTSYISSIKSSYTTTPQKYEQVIDVPDGATVMYASCSTSNKANFIILMCDLTELYNTVGTYDENLLNINSELVNLNNVNLEWTDGYYRESDDVISYAQFSYATINITGVKKVKVKTWIFANASIVFYNGTSYISGIKSDYTSMNKYEQIIDVPEGATIMYATCGKTYKSDFVVSMYELLGLYNTVGALAKNVSDIETVLNLNNDEPLKTPCYDGGFATCFESICCIGDSLNAGNLNYSNPTYGEIAIPYTSYPSTMQRILNNTVYNRGEGGAVACNTATAISEHHSYLYIANNKAWLNTTDKSQAYVIALGTNDITYYGGFTGDVATDIDVNDYNNNADTSVGGYATIIQKIKEIQPEAKIFCVCIPKTRNTVETRSVANTKIKAIANTFTNCYVIDLETYGVQESDVTAWIANYYNGGHLNALGYNIHAKRIISYIDWIIRHNINDFRHIAFIGTIYS